MYSLDRMRKDLERLVTHWGHILQDKPNEIWEPSVPAFLQSPFWVGTTEATLSTIGSSRSGCHSNCHSDLQRPRSRHYPSMAIFVTRMETKAWEQK